MSLSIALSNYIYDQQRFVHKAELEDYARQLGYLADNCGRRLRELEAEGTLIGRLNEHGVKEYRYVPPTERF